MKLNLPKALVKYISIAILAVVVFYLIYLYVKFTNDRVYDFAADHVLQSEIKSEDETSDGAEDSNKITEPKDIKKDAIMDTEDPPADAKGVAYKTNGKKFVPGKSTHACMAELNTKVINNAVVQCAHDHYVSIGN